MSKPTIFCDVDSTVYDLVPHIVEAVREVTGEMADPADINEWDCLQVRYGSEAALRIFTRALDPERLYLRRVYPDCRMVLGMLRNLGVRVVFATHNHDPEAMREPLTRWLGVCFWSEPEVLVTTSEHSKIDALMEYDAPVGIIDDRPDTIIEAVKAGLLTSTITTPWNEDTLRRGHPHVLPFKTWGELQDITHPFWFALTRRVREMKREGAV